MRLSLKLALAVTIGIALVLAGQALLNVRRIAELQEREIRSDIITLARTLSNATSTAWAAGGHEQALSFVTQSSGAQDLTTVQLVTDEELNRLPPLEPAPRLQRVSNHHGWHIEAIVPVNHDGRAVAALRIARQLPDERRDFASILQLQAGTAVLTALLSGLIVFILSAWLVGRPIAKLSNLARRVAEGDFTPRSDVDQPDEIGELANELNAMTDRLAESHQNVRSERRARTEALEKLRHADRLSTVGRLASGMAHELGTPLNIVSGRAMMIASDDTLPQEAVENAQSIVDQSQRMTDIIRDVLDFARRKEPERVDVRIGDVLEHAVSLMEPICEDRKVDVVVLGRGNITARIDPGKVLQVLTNLMMNAVHAMPEGGTITLRVDREHVEDPKDRHAAKGDFVKISVEDEGVGIAPERLGEIFDAFFTTKKEGEGTGLGLSVCHGIMREHGGWIEVQSEVGRGSRFTIFLPERGEP
jgi:signal transduction histidine kinase